MSDVLVDGPDADGDLPENDPPALALRVVSPPPPLPTKLCPAGHPSNPDSERCMDCNHPFDEATEIISREPGPVARLLLEDGTGVDLVNDLLIGRSPMDSDGGDTLTVTGRQVSRKHLQLSIDGWMLRIQDCDSTNGTFLSRRGERGRRRVGSDAATPVRIGDSIHFGSRQALVVRVQ